MLINSYTLTNSVQVKQYGILMHVISCFGTPLIPNPIVLHWRNVEQRSETYQKKNHCSYVKINEDVLHSREM
jgi:hypothetical protein